MATAAMSTADGDGDEMGWHMRWNGGRGGGGDGALRGDEEERDEGEEGGEGGEIGALHQVILAQQMQVRRERNYM